MRPSITALALVAVLASAPAFAQEAGKAKLSSHDREFATKAMTGNMFEIQLGQIATRQAANAEVKQFGQRMVDDHGKANQQLTTIAERHGLTPPKHLTSGERREMDKVSGLQGEAFDSAYMPMMVKEHQKDIHAYRKEVSEGQNPDLKRYAQDTLPILEKHLSLAQSLAPQKASVPESRQR